ncbi:kelch-like protein 3 [Saccostrea cucullata]|uniref:kelch-like protein 3 n=1 Tax=Saccostrea cuccullata TaxID=36930 RepID=UPI002ED0BEF5
MATACKVPKLCLEKSNSEPKESCSGEDETQKDEPKTAFPPTDVILEVEGMDIHLNKQALADHSSVFKAMFESEFSEKNKDRISLPGKKYGDFVTFLHTFYYPGFLAPITEQNVLRIACLADEYQIIDVKEKCESFILENCKRACVEVDYRIKTETVVEYASYAEKHNMKTGGLPLIIKLCSKYGTETLKQANFETKVTADTQRKILEVRCSFLEKELASTLEKGDGNILKSLELAWATQNEAKLEKYEDSLVSTCRQINVETVEGLNGTISTGTLLDYIIAAERFKLRTLLFLAIELASKCPTSMLKKEYKYIKISSLTKSKIESRRLQRLESKC